MWGDAHTVTVGGWGPEMMSDDGKVVPCLGTSSFFKCFSAFSDSFKYRFRKTNKSVLHMCAPKHKGGERGRLKA